MSSTRRVAGVLAAVAIVALAGCGTAGVDTPTFAPTTTDAITATTTAGDDAYQLGERAELAQDDATIAVRVVDYRLVNAYETTTDSGETETIEAPAGQQFLFVKVSAEHVDGPAAATPAVAVRPRNVSVDVSGDVPESFADGIYRSVRELPVGETSTGWIAVQVDDDVVAEDVRVAFSPDFLVTSDEYRWTLDEDDD